MASMNGNCSFFDSSGSTINSIRSILPVSPQAKVFLMGGM